MMAVTTEITTMSPIAEAPRVAQPLRCGPKGRG
jgi:hypothetical protein